MKKTRVTRKGIGTNIQFMRRRDYSNTRGPNFSKVEALRTANPCATLQEIGDQVGLSRERVRQILHRGSQPTAHFRQKYICATCSKEFLPKSGRSKTFCCEECFYDWHHIQLVCDVCGKLFRRDLNDFMHHLKDPRNTGGGIYCSKTCFGHRPNNPRAKFNWPEVIQVVAPLLKQGASASSLAKIYKVSPDLMQRHIRRAGLMYHFRHANLTPDLITKILGLRASGLTYREISKSLHISESALAKFVAIHNLSDGRKFRRASTMSTKVRWLCHLNFGQQEIQSMTGCSKHLYLDAFHWLSGRG